MTKLETKKRHPIVRVQTEARVEEIASIFQKYGWRYFIGLEPDKKEDITDLERLLNPPQPQISEKKIERNEPCSCLSSLISSACFVMAACLPILRN